MLLEFTVSNFLSFKELVTLSLEAAGISEYPENAFEAGRYRLLKSAVVYGANASGKSNLIEAMYAMRDVVLSTASMASTDAINVTPFLLSTETRTKASHFEILILLDGIRYRYGFEVTSERVQAEWLFSAKAEKEKPLFIREGNAIEVSRNFREGKDLEERTRENALFLGVVDQFNGATAKRIMKWFDLWMIISGVHHYDYRRATFQLFNIAHYQPVIKDFLRQLDLGFSDVKVLEEKVQLPGLSALPDEARENLGAIYSIKPRKYFKTVHEVFDEGGGEAGRIEFDLDHQESAGTRKVFDLLGLVFSALGLGGILVVDELDSKLHPLLTKSLVLLFNSQENNPNNAQLIFATHDTNLLSQGNFRRDQIYFVEKDRRGATDLYSLLEYKEDGETIRKDRSFEKDYIQGRYGAIPYLGDFSKLFSQWPKEEKEESPIG